MANAVQRDPDDRSAGVVQPQDRRPARLELEVSEGDAHDGAGDAIEVADFEDAAPAGGIPLDAVQDVLDRYHGARKR